MLIVPPRYGFTFDEIVQVVMARRTQFHVGIILCFCGRTKLWLSRDSGISADWAQAADVIDRLRRGYAI